MLNGISAILLSTCLIACSSGGDDDSGGSRADARRAPDAPTGGGGGGGGDGGGGGFLPDASGGGGGGGAMDGGAAMGCTAAADYGDMGAMTGAAEGSVADGYIYLDMMVNADPDYISIELYDGIGAFAAGIAPGTYTIAGEEADYLTCGACALIYANGAPLEGEMYMASSGTLELTSVETKITGTLTAATLRHITVDETTGDVIDAPDGCMARVGRISFDQALPTP